MAKPENVFAAAWEFRNGLSLGARDGPEVEGAQVGEIGGCCVRDEEGPSVRSGDGPIMGARVG